MSFKVGDIIICKQNCVMYHNHSIAATKNKSYKITSISDTDFCIVDNSDRQHSFDLDDISESYYGIWFYEQKEYRKLKLEKLNSI